MTPNVKVRGCALLRSPSRLPGWALSIAKLPLPDSSKRHEDMWPELKDKRRKVFLIWDCHQPLTPGLRLKFDVEVAIQGELKSFLTPLVPDQRKLALTWSHTTEQVVFA